MALSPSERVKLIQEIARRLSAEDWGVIDMTLSAFALPTANSWNGGEFPYVLKMVEKAPDNTLLALAEHVGFRAKVASPPRVDPPFWRKNMLKLFVTHLACIIHDS